MEELNTLINKFKSEVQRPSDDWDRGWNAALKFVIRELEGSLTQRAVDAPQAGA